jgi:hypothetical protein
VALPAGAYEATLRAGGQIYACSLALADEKVVAIDLGACTITSAVGLAKGQLDDAPENASPPDAPPPEENLVELREIDHWSAEISLGPLSRAKDAYTDTLGTFGYQRDSAFLDLPSFRLSLGIARYLAPHLTLLVQGQTLGGDSYSRDVSGQTDHFDFHGFGGGAYLRAHADLVPRLLRVYGQAGGGAAYATSFLSTAGGPSGTSTHESSWGYLLGLGGGVLLAPESRLGGFVQVGYDRAPALANLLGDRHDLGGFYLSLGLQVRFGRVQ